MNLRKQTVTNLLQVGSTADVSTIALGSSPVFTADSNNLSPKCHNEENFEKRLLLHNLKGDFLIKKVKSAVPSVQDHRYKNSCFTPITGNQLSDASNSDYRTPSEKFIHLERAKFNTSCVKSEIGNGNDVLGSPSISQNICTLESNCDSSCKQRKKCKRQASIKQDRSALCERETENDFLKAILAPVESSQNKDSSYEDYFVSANWNKNIVEGSLPCHLLQKLQSPNKMLGTHSPSRNKQEVILQASSKKDETSSRKRKRIADIR